MAVCSLWHFPASHLGLPLAITLLCEVRTFLEPSAAPVPHGLANGPRPPGQLVRAINVLLRWQFREHAIIGGMPQVPPARYLLRAKDLVDARYAEPITVDDLAAAAGLSRAHFSRMFTRTFGESPRAYLQTRRLERAAALLRYTDRSVADICVMVGLQSVGSFTTSFARVYGQAARRLPRQPAARRQSTRGCRVASCSATPDRPPTAASRQHTGRRRRAAADRSVVPMMRIASAHLWVHDQEVALKYWTEQGRYGSARRRFVSGDRRLPMADGRPAAARTTCPSC